ncbi:DUF5615 family PIN-like protein [Echinicola rosea]|uniref:DUF5615 domain-containing protein n=1 Tax=Echinicola rosea TaxID=1807691 RepID=A0ABQ1V4I3_9BACT|nr:DUF5615 family PIN-like protein [Echinicola rosea]GGF38598.1 hypothetical protein GCM10011339_28990 [Echinicola rosea]
MKVLFDQNVSFRIVNLLKDYYTEAKQVRLLGLENARDLEIWEYAKQKNYTIVTFDADFYELANIKGHPPKIIWLRMGNTSTKSIAEIMISMQPVIADFILSDDQEEIACLEID